MQFLKTQNTFNFANSLQCSWNQELQLKGRKTKYGEKTFLFQCKRIFFLLTTFTVDEKLEIKGSPAFYSKSTD